MEQGFPLVLVTGGEVKYLIHTIMKILIYSETDVILLDDKKEGVGVFYNTEKYNYREFETESEALEFITENKINYNSTITL